MSALPHRDSIPTRLYLRHIAAALGEPDGRVRHLYRSGQLPTRGAPGRNRYTTPEELLEYAAEHGLHIDWDALADLHATELGMDPDDYRGNDLDAA